MARLAVVCLGAVLLASCTPAAAEPEETASPDPEVDTLTVVRERHDAELRLNGTIESLHDVVVSAEVAGRVVSRPAPEGGIVAAGATVVALEETPYRLQRDLARVAADEAALHPDVPAAERATAELGLQVAQDRLDRCRIAAPVRATVEKLLVEVGEWVGVGAPVARLVDRGELKLVVHVSEDVVVVVSDGTRVSFTVDARGPREFAARVSRVGGAADAATGKFEVELRVESPAPAALLVGMFARARLPVAGDHDMIRLAKKAVRHRFGESYCLILHESGGVATARERRLRIAPIVGDPSHVEVMHGLDPGDRVITGPFTGLRDGVHVRVAGATK